MVADETTTVLTSPNFSVDIGPWILESLQIDLRFFTQFQEFSNQRIRCDPSGSGCFRPLEKVLRAITKTRVNRSHNIQLNTSIFVSHSMQLHISIVNTWFFLTSAEPNSTDGGKHEHIATNKENGEMGLKRMVSGESIPMLKLVRFVLNLISRVLVSLSFCIFFHVLFL